MATNKKTVKTVTKKPVSKAKPVNNTSKVAKKELPPAKKTVAKKVAPKPTIKNAKPANKKTVTPIKKTAPVKKTVKPEVKKAVSKTLNQPIKNSASPAKKAEKPHPKTNGVEVKSPVKAVAKAEVPKAASKKSESKLPELKPLPKAKDIKVAAPKPLVLPKITSTRSRIYEPEFTKSVLDQPAYEHKGPSMRYSDGELNEFRELIQRKLETAKKELAYLQGLITRKDEMGGDDTDNRYMTMEDGSLSMEREQLSQMASRQITFIDHLEKAMMRIENKTYGICRVTGKLIDKARLRAVPHATLSIEAKMGIVK